jgi:hypothetical protein
MKFFKNPIAKGIFFVFAALLVSEIFLRSVGSGYLLLRDFIQGREAGDVILCVGESTTAFGFSMSYPAQLQSQLNEIYGPGKYRVVNAGTPGINSDKILAQMPDLLSIHHPFLVITMMGIMDAYPMPDPAWYSEIRLYKIARWLWLYTTDRDELKLKFEPTEFDDLFPTEASPSPAYLSLLYHDPETAEKQYAEIEKTRPLTAFETWQMARCKFYNGKQEEGRTYLNKYVELSGGTAQSHLLAAWFDYNRTSFKDIDFKINHLNAVNEKDPDNANMHWLKGLVYRNSEVHPVESEKEFLRALELQPCEPKSVHSLWKLYDQTGQKDKAAVLENSCKEVLAKKGIDDPENANHNRKPAIENEKYHYNYRKISALIKASGARHAVMQYPVRNIDTLKKIFEGDDGITFISNQETFEKMLTKHKFSDLFVDDFAGNFGHATPLGNKTIATQIIKVLRDEKVLP